MAVKHESTKTVHKGKIGGRTGCGFDTKEMSSHWVNSHDRINCGKNGCKN